MSYILSDTQLVTVTESTTEANQATFTIEPLSPGYGVTIGNTLRRILLGSMEGAAITSVRVDGATHEFTAVPGVREDMVNVILQLKQVRLRLHGDDAASLVVQKKGPGTVTVADFKANPAVEFINPDHVIAHLDKGANFSMEIEVRKGRGYSSTESRRDEKLPLGTIALDSIFSPVTRVTFDVENTRVGNLTNYNKLHMSITTDGSITPQDALQTASKIAVEHFAIVAGNPTEQVSAADADVATEETTEDEKPKRRARKTKESSEA